MPWTHPVVPLDVEKHHSFTEAESSVSSSVSYKSSKASWKNVITSSFGASRTNDAKVEYFASSDPDWGGQGKTTILLFVFVVCVVNFVLQISGLDGDLPSRPKNEKLLPI